MLIESTPPAKLRRKGVSTVNYKSPKQPFEQRTARVDVPGEEIERPARSARMTEDERLQELRSDPDAKILDAKRTLCRRCDRIISETSGAYRLCNWRTELN
ncbi:hypothetical protein R3P38DRAFT_3235294 [Favolaschia claudopus]|uniref:Uncharacterized protein n=1 Tax=Favolaschia claudopus TaxID=2862362 RepID=A0AAV9ZEY9_9AGAR